MADDKLERKTAPGFGDPHAVVRGVPVQPVGVQPARASAASASQRPRAARGRPLVEVEVIRERTCSPRPWPFEGCYEIWTQNHVYVIDARMRCVEVRTPRSNELRSDHPFLGARLVGGHLEEEAVEMSYPLPRPGAFAVFELRKKTRRQFVRTSAVERVVLRLRIVTIADGGDVPSWEELIEGDE